MKREIVFLKNYYQLPLEIIKIKSYIFTNENLKTFQNC